MSDAEITMEIEDVLAEAVACGSESQKYLCDCYSARKPELVRRLKRLMDEKTCRRLPATNDCVCIVMHKASGIEREFGYWKCSRCGTDCFEGAKYCMGCGAKVVVE